MLFSKQTPAAGGTAFAQFDAAWCYDGNGYILNDTGTSLDVRIGASGSVQTLASGATLPIKLVFSMAELYVRRTDQSATQVTVEAQVGTGSAGDWTTPAQAEAIAAAKAAAAVAGLPEWSQPDTTSADARAALGAGTSSFDGAFGSLTSKPTTLLGYGITNAQELDSDLTALAGNSTNGLWARTGAGAGAARTITGTTDQVVVTNGNGVSGNPTLALPQSIAATSTPQFARIGIGGAAASAAALYHTGPTVVAASSYGFSDWPTVQPGTSQYVGFSTYLATAAGSYTIADLIHFNVSQAAIGAGSAVTQQTGFLVSSGLTGATSNFGFRSTLTAGTGRWNIYFPGTAQNYIAGNVGIGVEVPTSQLHTTGTVRFAGFGAGTLGTDSSGNISVSSDARLKNVSGKFTRGLDAIAQIQPKVFTWKPESGMNTEDVNVGFIAQDVQDAIPEAVGSMKTVDTEEDDGTGKKVKSTKREASEFLTLSDRPIIAALVNAVKELKAENDALLARVSALENGKAAPFTTAPLPAPTRC